MVEAINSWINSNEKQVFAALRLTVGVGLICVAFFLGYRLMDVAWMYIAGPEPTPRPKTVSHHANAPVTANWGIADRHLFGIADAKVEPAEPVSGDIEAPETRLKLVLKGVFVGPEADKGSAIISEQGGAGLKYLIGDALPGGATLHSVYADKVIIRYRGQLETLSFDEPNVSGGFVAQQAPRAKAPQQQSNGAAGVVGAMTPQAANQWVRSIGLQPVSDNQAQGYRVNQPVGVLAKAGLKQGDVILSINGHDVGDVRRDLVIAQDMQGGDLEVVVKRGDQVFTVRQDF